MNRGLLQQALRSREGALGFGLLAMLGLLAVTAGFGWIASGWDQSLAAQWSGPSLEHWFGTNRLGQDVLDRALIGLVTALVVGGSVTLGSVLLGALLGGIAGWRAGSLLDEALQYLMGVIDSVPVYLLAVALAYSLGGGETAIVLAMVLSFWTATARLVRAEVARLREREFVLSARAIGLPARAILWRHLLPNTLHILLVQGTLTFVAAIKTEVILSFLGIGAQEGVSWGLMLAESTQDVLAGHFGNFLAASLLLFLVLLGLNLLADALQDAFDLREPAR
jgi:ABC-type dipeptide/oligopeptide/nickel transport system permease subunit